MRGERGGLGHALALVLAACSGDTDAASTTSAATTTGEASDAAVSEGGDAPVPASDGDPMPAESSGDPGNSSDSDDTGSDSTGEPSEREFVPFECDAASPDVTVDRLCDEAADPEAAKDKIFITCRLEGSCSAPREVEPKEALVVMAYNVERGYHVDEHIALMLDDDPILPLPDVLLISEADRGCTRTDDRNIAWDYAEGLGMNHVYGVEFVELPRPDGSITAPCEHGNAILSRYPIGNVEAVRHETNKSWYETDEPRLGGRMAVVADILVGDKMLQLHSLHFESGVFDGLIRAAQAAELADLALARGTPAVIGGDTNAGGYILDLTLGTHNEQTTEAFFERGFVDTHAALPATERVTHPPGLVLDIMFTSEPLASEPVVCPAAACEGLSDHLPIWASIAVP